MSDKGRTTGRRTSGKGRKSDDLPLLDGLGHPVMVGRPVVPGGRTSEKVSVVRRIWVNARCEFGMRFWAEIGDFLVKIDEILWMKIGEKMGKARST